MTTNQTGYEQFGQHTKDADETAKLSEGDTVIGPGGQEYRVLNAGPFEVYAENRLTQQRHTMDTRNVEVA